jgi:hypothetical protein
MPYRILLALGLAAVAAFALASSGRERREVGLKESLRDWENEGGSVPQVPTVRPVLPAPRE